MLSILLVLVMACEKMDYNVPAGEGTMAVCNIKDPKEDLVWIEQRINDSFRAQTRGKYLTVYFGILRKSTVDKSVLQHYLNNGLFKSRDMEQVVMFKTMESKTKPYNEWYWMYDCEGKPVTEGGGPGLSDSEAKLRNLVYIKSFVEL